MCECAARDCVYRNGRIYFAPPQAQIVISQSWFLYHFDEQRHRRFTTVEIIVAESCGFHIRSLALFDYEFITKKSKCSVVSSKMAVFGILRKVSTIGP
jgi:hypothetical protein